MTKSKKKKPPKNTEASLTKQLMDELAVSVVVMLRDVCEDLNLAASNEQDEAVVAFFKERQGIYSGQALRLFALFSQIGAARSGDAENRDRPLDEVVQEVYELAVAGKDPIAAFLAARYGPGSIVVSLDAEEN